MQQCRMQKSLNMNLFPMYYCYCIRKTDPSDLVLVETRVKIRMNLSSKAKEADMRICCMKKNKEVNVIITVLVIGSNFTSESNMQQHA